MSSPSGIAGIVLAGGRSSRMNGQDKANIVLCGRTLLDWTVARLAPQVGAIAVNSNADPQTLSTGSLPVIADTLQGYAGPLAGILAGMEWASAQGVERLATAACDTPFFPPTLVARLSGANGISLASSNGRVHPVFGIWPTHLIDDLREYLQHDARRSVLAYAERRGYAAFEFQFDRGTPDPFFNVNTPQDLADAERFAQEFAQ